MTHTLMIPKILHNLEPLFSRHYVEPVDSIFVLQKLLHSLSVVLWIACFHCNRHYHVAYRPGHTGHLQNHRKLFLVYLFYHTDHNNASQIQFSWERDPFWAFGHRKEHRHNPKI